MIIKEFEKPPTWVRMNALSSGDTPDPIKTIELALDNATKPKLEEPAIVHPFNTSIVKVRNNGMIDMFVGTDQGIRIDPYSKTINEIVDGLKWHVGYFKGWIDDDAKWYAKMGFLFESESGSFNVKVKQDISLECEGNLTLRCDGNLNLQCGGDFNLSGDGAGMNIKGGNLDFKGKGTSTMDGDSIISSASSTVTIDGVGVARLGDRITMSSE